MKNREEKELSPLEAMIAAAPARRLPNGLRERMREEMADVVDELEVEAERRKRRFAWWSIAAVVALSGGLAGFFSRTEPMSSPIEEAPFAVEGSDTDTPASLEEVVRVNYDLGRSPVGEMIDINDRPVQVYRRYGLEQHRYIDSQTGAIVQIAVPRQNYEIEFTNIQ